MLILSWNFGELIFLQIFDSHNSSALRSYSINRDRLMRWIAISSILLSLSTEDLLAQLCSQSELSRDSPGRLRNAGRNRVLDHDGGSR